MSRNRSMRWRVALSLFCVCLIPAPSSADRAILPIIAEVGPWPTIGKLIAYEGRLWFVNSVTGRNHNSADVYSYDPLTGEIRYERHLFSQDAGDPVVADGLLYWPSEDPRVSLGWGDLQVTNGRDWVYQIVPTGQHFHVHAMAMFKGRLMAATSAWRAGLSVSPDGAHWEAIYEHPTPEGRVSRIVDLAVDMFGNRLYAHMLVSERSHLIVYDGSSVTLIDAWPRGASIMSVAAEGGWVNVLARDENGFAIWQIDTDKVSDPIRLSPEQKFVDLVACDGAFCAVTRGGEIWWSADGKDWSNLGQRTSGGGWASEIYVVDGNTYVAGTSDDGRGILWGHIDPLPVRAIPLRPLPDLPQIHFIRMPDWDEETDRLRVLIADPATYERRAVLRDFVWFQIQSRAPASLFAAAFDAAAPELTLDLIGGSTQATARRLAQWIGLWGIGFLGRGNVPSDYISTPWESSANRAEKYFDLPPLAMWAATRVGQNDRATLDALIDRLDRPGDPDWLIGDAVGALQALTGEDHRYDVAAWQNWWTSARETWPQ